LTGFTSRTELFAEFNPFIAGAETPIAAHVTDLRDFSAVRSGRFEAILRNGDGRVETFSADGVLRPGIFRPVVKPTAPGEYDLSFRLTAPNLADVISGGRVVVYPDAARAAAASPKAENEGADEISYLKEQQWKVTFGTAVVESAALAEGIALQGTVRSAAGREAYISSPEAGLVVPGKGRLPRLGDRVKRGDVLAVLTPALGHGRDRAGLAAAFAEARATRKQAEDDLARAERLAKAGAGPASRVTQLRTALSIARTAEAAAEHEYEAATAARDSNAQVTEDSFFLRAPVSGTIVDARPVPGAFVGAGDLFYQIIDLSEVWVEARIPESDVLRAEKARAAEVQPPGAPQGMAALKGRLVTLGGIVDAKTRTVAGVYAVANPQTRLRIGMSVRVRALTGKSASSPVLPRTAVVDDNGRPIAYVQTGGESFERRELVLGTAEGDLVQVLSGVTAGERAVTKGAYEIRLSTLSGTMPEHAHLH
ncbi:MAG: efflux RND transporter periplasmic adaptor subunit, partial [Candidatus Sericytochromatia bacterium]|nr:efflux RND transporter periplasmic adaptor subunit [Candidatus Tanganyikabacteria bacterium]